MSDRRHPAQWIGINVNNQGVRYFGREALGLEALTYGGDWYLHYGEDRDGVWLYRLPRWWQWKWRGKRLDAGRVRL